MREKEVGSSLAGAEEPVGGLSGGSVSWWVEREKKRLVLMLASV